MPFAKNSNGGTSSSKWGSSSSVNTDPYSVDKLTQQIDNANIRIKDAGFTPQNTDQRNGFERFLNLPQKQNWFFDTLEILGRPGNAVKNVLDKAVGYGAKESIGEAALKGISGREKVSGAQMVKDHLGIENGFSKFLLGTALDIGTDPLTFVPGGVLAKGVTVPAKLVGKAAKGVYNATESIVPGLKTLRETKIEPALQSAKDGLGFAFNPNYKIDETLSGGKSTALQDLSQSTDNSRAFMNEEAMKNVTRAAKLAGGIDTGVDVGRVMEAPLKQFEDVKGFEFPGGVRRTTNKSDLTDALNVNRNTVQTLGKEVNQTRKQYDTQISQTAKELEKTDKSIRRQYFSEENKAKRQTQPFNITKEEFQKMADSGDYFIRTVRTPGKDMAGRVSTPAGKTGIELGLSRDTHKGLSGFNLKDQSRMLEWMGKEGWEHQNVAVYKGKPTKEQVVLDKGEVEFKPSQLIGYVPTKLFKDYGGDFHKAATNKTSQTALDKVSSSPAFNYLLNKRDELKLNLDSLRGESKTVIADKIGNIQKLVGDTQDLKQSIKNPILIQKEIVRPARELSTDPKIQQAAKTLMESNATIRQFAAENGIQINEMEGYMTHVFSQAERESRKINKPINVDSGAFGAGNPNKSILKQRENMGSVEDINDRFGKSKFEPNAYFATGIGQKRLIDYIHAVSLRKEVLQNHDFAKLFIKGMDVPKNAEVIDSNNYTFLKDSGDSLDGIVSTEKVGGQYIVTKQAKMVLDRYQKLNTDEGTKAFLTAFDGLQGLWKKGALFSLGYHFRNQAGATFNNYVAGMSTLDLARYTPEAFKEVSKSLSGAESALFTEYRKQGLGSNTLSQVEFAKVGQEPEQAIQKTVENMSKDTKGQIKQRLNPLNAFETSQEVGNFFDQANRFALFNWFVEKNKGKFDDAELYKKAAAKVREVQFDYSKTTPFEKNIATRVFPFYRWMRNNIPFQIKSFVNDPRKYEYLNKARLNAQEAVGLNENNIPDYMKESFALPLYGQNGKGKMLGLNLPLTDLTKLSKPGKTLVDAVTPLVKTPAELALNYNTFYGKAIQKFTGQQKQYQIPYTDIAFGVPVKGAYAFEQATGQIGRGFSGFLQKPDTKDQDIINRLPSLGISSLTKPFDAEKYAYYEKLDQLKQLQDLMLFIQQQTGEKPKTISQIKH